jgi:hypothetical protein
MKSRAFPYTPSIVLSWYDKVGTITSNRIAPGDLVANEGSGIFDSFD